MTELSAKVPLFTFYPMHYGLMLVFTWKDLLLRCKPEMTHDSLLTDAVVTIVNHFWDYEGFSDDSWLEYFDNPTHISGVNLVLTDR